MSVLRNQLVTFMLYAADSFEDSLEKQTVLVMNKDTYMLVALLACL